jgi:hypothetical protein
MVRLKRTLAYLKSLWIVITCQHETLFVCAFVWERNYVPDRWVKVLTATLRQDCYRKKKKKTGNSGHKRNLKGDLFLIQVILRPRYRTQIN